MSMEPINRRELANLNSDEILAPLSWRGRREVQRQASMAVFQAALDNFLAKMKLHGMAALENENIDLHKQLAERIMQEMAATDNPLQQMALERQWQGWLNRSESLLNWYSNR